MTEQAAASANKAQTNPELPPEKTGAPVLIANRYQVVNRLVGGMGIVYLCNDRITHDLVALKTFKPEYISSRPARDMFLREGTMWVELGKHPNIVQAYRVERIGDGREVYLVLEWVQQPEGKRTPSLRSWLRKGKPLPLEQAILFALHIARGMKYATKKLPGLVHRDLKPENILIGVNGQARVTDFGLASTLTSLGKESAAATLDDLPELFNRTQLTQGAAGTPLYMAPEQWLQLKLDARADIYALGCIFYEMVTGRFAAEGKEREELKEIHLKGHIKPLDSSLPRDVHLFLRKCLATRPIERYPSWKEVESTLVGMYTVIFGKPAPEERIDQEDTREERLRAANSYNTMGLSYLDIGKLDVAVMYFEQVVNIARREGSREVEGIGLGNLGRVYTALGYIERAIDFHEEHLTIAHQLRDRSQEGFALGNLGRAYRQSREPEKAIRYHERELQIAHELADRFKEAAALHSLGESYRQVGNAEKAVAYYQQSLAIARDIGDRARVERILNSMGKFYLSRGESKEAVTLFKQTLEIARQIGDRVGEGEAWGNLGTLYEEMGNPDRAVEFYQHALTISQESKDLNTLFRNLMRLGNLYLKQHHIIEASEYLLLALDTALEMGDQNREMEARFKLGIVLKERGEYFEAARLQRQALRLAQEMGNQEQEEKSLLELSRAYEAWGDWGRAIEYLAQTFYMVEKRNNLLEQARYYGQLGALYRRSAQWKAALELYEKALELAQRAGNLAMEIELLNHIATTLNETNDSKEALARLKEALDLARERNYDVGEAATLSNLGLIHQDMGNKRAAISHLERGLATAKKTKRNTNVAAASYKLAKVLVAQERWDKAEPHARLAHQLYSKMNKTQMVEILVQMLDDIEKNKGRSAGFFGSTTDFLRSAGGSSS
ncbi:MAG: tetratricopeptide repeat protein [Chloroflexi bacterium]|nr:tetratricopeptide repeat protein [Ardenticatenaceae bacterium]MBL1131356.1 serine/threonine-protein kinase [Chloroflexota bacterium]NOG37458.1 tetratricopeptide repeat protein [Chloroflexota bacterium]